MQKALFLDRDGVVNLEKNYLYKIEDFEFIGGVFETCRYFQDQGYIIIVITNQSGISRGKYTKEQFDYLTSWMVDEFKEKDIDISHVYHCPHHPDFSGECECRKPKPGMIYQAKEQFDIDLAKSILVGDNNSDIKAGLDAGIKQNYLVSTRNEVNKYNVKILSNIKELTLYKK
jgi:D-glycero-D-manno-heptose 1,7-bisphosphate phosphatase